MSTESAEAVSEGAQKKARAWVVRGEPNEGPSMVEYNLANNVVTLGWGESVVGARDDAFNDKAMLRRYIEQWHEEDMRAGRSNWNKGKALSNVWQFWNEIEVGHVVLLPPKGEQWTAIGRVASRATLDGEQPRGARLRREVEWLDKEFQKSRVPRDLSKSIWSPGTVFEIRPANAHNRILRLVDFIPGGWSGDEAGVISANGQEVPEGAKSKAKVNRYERDRRARKRCLIHFNFTCQVCDLKFEDRYGEFALEYMQVHHIVPLSQITDHDNYRVNPLTDLVAVCPNCHAMLHHHPDDPCSVETLRQLMAEVQE